MNAMKFAAALSCALMPAAAFAQRMDAQPVDHSTMGMPGMRMQDAHHDMAPLQRTDMPSPDATDTAQVPALTDADRIAARLPAMPMHDMGDDALHDYVLLDRLEAWHGDAANGQAWKADAWFGTDTNRLWLRSEGERGDARLQSADAEALFGHSVSAWWDVVAGVREDFKPGAAQTFAAFGVQGLAPQEFEVQLTAYLGEGGQGALRFEIERDLLLTNRLILQPSLQADAWGKDDAARAIGAGLGSAEFGMRLRYEFARRFAPYFGVEWQRAFGATAGLRRVAGESAHETRVVAGVRTWF